MKERSVRPPTNSSPKREGGNHTLGTEGCRVSDSADGCPVPRSPSLLGASRSRRMRSRTNWAATARATRRHSDVPLGAVGGHRASDQALAAAPP